jgi:hypothetical protein
VAEFLLTKGVREYRSTISWLVNDRDCVLEVGAAWGTTSALLAERAHVVVAIDTSSSIKTARQTYPHVRFEQIDGFDIAAILGLGVDFSKVYLDISGSRPPEAVMLLARRYETALRPEVIVIKNTRLKRFVQRCRFVEKECY